MIPYLFYTLLQSQYIKIDQDHFSEPTDVIVDISQDVDLEASEFFYQGNQIFSNSNELMFTVKDENESVFKYVLKDKEGNILEENEHSFYLDTQAPVISTSFNEYVLENSLYVQDKSDIHISTSDTYLEKVEIYVDDVLVSTEVDATIQVSKDSKNIKVVALDTFGHETIKKVDVFDASSTLLKANVENEAYTLDSKVHFEFDDVVNTPLSLVVYEDGIETQRILCLGKSSIDVILDKESDVSFKLVCDNAEYLNYQINGLDTLNLHFTNQLPSLELSASAYLSSSDINIYSSYQSRYLKNIYYEVFDGLTTTIYDYQDVLTLTGNLNAHTNYVVKVILEDMFGQVVSQDISVSIDRKAPSFSLLKNSYEVMNNSSNIVSKNDVFNLSLNEHSNVLMTLYKNGNLLQNVSLNQAIQGLSYGDILQVDYVVSDNLQNTNYYQYFFELEKPKFSSDILETTWKYNGLKDNKKSNSVKYTWKVDKNNRLIFNSFTKENRNDKPNLELVRKDENTLRLVLMSDENSNTEFETIEINGNKVNLTNLKKDKLNQSYYEFKSLDDVHIKAVAKDQKGISTVLEKDIKVDTGKWAYPVFLSVISALLFGFVYLVKKLKNA